MAVVRLGLCRHRAWLAFGGVVSRAFNLQPTINRPNPPTFVNYFLKKSPELFLRQEALYHNQVIWLGSRQRCLKLSRANKELVLPCGALLASVTARNLGVSIDERLTFDAHARDCSRACFYHLRRIRQTRHFLDERALRQLVHALVTSLLDHCNALFANCCEGVSRDMKSAKAEVNGVQLYYDMIGNGRHVVVLLPGVLGCASMSFSGQMDKLNKDLFTLIALDPRGYGRSRPPERQWSNDYLLQDAEDVVKLLQKLRIERYTLMGSGDGGASAVIAAALYPDRIRRLVIWGLNAEVSREDRPIYDRLQNFDAWDERARKLFLGTYPEQFVRMQLRNWVEANIRYYVTEKEGDRCRSYLEYVKCPTLVIHGEKDTIVNFRQSELIREKVKGARLVVIPDGQHNVHQQKFQQFNRTVEEFLVEMDKS